MTINAATGRDGARSVQVTRARRRYLSGEDAQLFQLGERAQFDLQGEGYATQGQLTDPTADSSRGQP